MQAVGARRSIDQLRNIFVGWRNVVVKNPEIEKRARARNQVCMQCPHRKLVVCGKCGCPLKAKTHAPHATCTDNRWPA